MNIPTGKNNEYNDRIERDSALDTAVGSACRRCGRETGTPNRCKVCAQEDEWRAAPMMLEAIIRTLEHPATFVDNTVADALERARDAALGHQQNSPVLTRSKAES